MADNLLKREPAMIAAAVQSGLVLATAFGLNLDTDQMTALMATMPIFVGLFTRSQVSPAKRPPKAPKPPKPAKEQAIEETPF